MPLQPREIKRYSRQILLNDIGLSGQQKLKQARVLVIGAGGLGCPVLTYLAAAGIGHIGIVDHDNVEDSNLHRQTLYTMADVGSPKAQAARSRLLQNNPEITVDAHVTRLTAANATDFFNAYDLIADCIDNFSGRFLINDTCMKLNKRYVHASIHQFEGMLSVFGGSGQPCYRCLYPQQPPDGFTGSCSEAGVLGVLPGILGSLQATEILKLILDIGNPLSGRLLRVDSKQMAFTELELTRRSECLCQQPDTIKISAEDSDALVNCAIENTGLHMSVTDLRTQLDNTTKLILVDIRGSDERQQGFIEHDIHIPLEQLKNTLNEHDRDKQIVLYCLSGKRSEQAARQLSESGFTNVRSLTGGYLRWLAMV